MFWEVFKALIQLVMTINKHRRACVKCSERKNMGIYKPGRPTKYNPTTGSGTAPQHKAGEYRIRNEGGTISYVGETNDLYRRMHQHQQSGKLNTTNGSTFEYKYADGRSTSVTRREHERAKIAQHNPSMNRSRGGEGRIAKH